MLPIRKNDIVSFVHFGNGRVIEVIATDSINVYKVQNLADRQIIYVEGRMIQLERQCLRSWLITYSKEVVNFLSYTLRITDREPAKVSVTNTSTLNQKR